VTSNYPASALAADKLNLNLALNEVNAALAALNAQTQAISAQKALNTNLLSQAQSQVDQAANSLSSAQSALKLKQSGSDPNQIKAQAAAVASAQANVDDVAAQLSKTVLLSPLTGVVSRQDGQVGEIIAPNQSFISLLSNAKFQVAAQVAEKDLGPLKVGQNASVILDAYGPSRPFAASIIAIDPASTIVNGQSFYKVTLEFATNDEAIKVGMNANVDIITSSLSNALLVPTSSLITSDNGDYVIVDNGTPSGRRQAVSIGLTGSNGLTEVKSGLTAGDKVAIFGSSAPSQN